MIISMDQEHLSRYISMDYIKTNRMRIKYFLLSIFITTSCSLDSYFVDLGDDYAEDIEYRAIVKIATRNPNAYSCDNVVPGEVIDYNYNKNCIIVHQLFHNFYTNVFYIPNEYDTLSMCKHDKDSIKAKIEKLRNMKDCYWIIFKKTNIVLGPFNKHDFDIRCKKEGINLKFEK